MLPQPASKVRGSSSVAASSRSGSFSIGLHLLHGPLLRLAQPKGITDGRLSGDGHLFAQLGHLAVSGLAAHPPGPDAAGERAHQQASGRSTYDPGRREHHLPSPFSTAFWATLPTM